MPDMVMMIGGVRVETGEWCDVENPATGEVIGRPPNAGS